MTGDVIDYVFAGQTRIRLYPAGDGDGWRLWWTDMVANDWSEWYPELSSALVRVAALVYCGECEWRLSFTHEPMLFSGAAEMFMREVTS